MTIAELEHTLEWNACTVKQQMWIQSFIASNGNALLATKQAYESGLQTGGEDRPRDLYAQMFSHQVRRNPHVRAVLNLYFGITEREAFLNQLQRRIEAGTLTVAEQKAASLLCRLRGWTKAGDLDETDEPENSENPTSRHQVGDIVLQAGQKFRVTSVTPDGNRILAADEVE